MLPDASTVVDLPGSNSTTCPGLIVYPFRKITWPDHRVTLLGAIRRRIELRGRQTKRVRPPSPAPRNSRRCMLIPLLQFCQRSSEHHGHTPDEGGLVGTKRSS